MSTHNFSRRTVMALFAGAGVSLAPRAYADAPDTRDEVIEGTVIYRERMMLPQGARVEVELVDASLADAPAVILARTEIANALASPIAYRLSYDPALLEAGHRYALQARISAEDRLLFINDTHHPFEPGRATREILVTRAVAQAEARHDDLPLAGSWLAEDILGGGVVDNAQTTLTIGEDGAVNGRGGCNRYGGSARIDGDSIEFGQLVSTQMACAGALMNQEQTFFVALGRVASFSIVQEERKLLLMDGGGDVLVRLAAM